MYPTFQFKTVFQNEALTIQLDVSHSFITLDWLQHPNTDLFREGFQKAAEVTLQHGIKYWLSDARAIHYLEFGNQNWLMNHMAPLLKQAKLLKFARLVTTESLELMDIVQVLDKLKASKELGITTQFELFTDREDALEWLFEDEPVSPPTEEG